MSMGVIKPKRRSLLPLLALAVCALFSADALAAIGTSTLGFDIEVAPGRSVSGSFLVFNGSDAPTEVLVELADFTRKLDGGVEIFEPGTQPRSLADYVSFSPTRFTLPAGAGQQQEVRFVISIPTEETGPHWAMLLVREIAEDQESGSAGEQQVGVKFDLQIGVQIRQIDPSHADNTARITRLEVLPQDGETPARVALEFENTGQVFQRPSGEIRIIDGSSVIVRRLDILPFRTLPGGKIRLEIPLPQDLEPGEYLALVIIDFSGNFLVAGQVRFQTP